MDAGDLNTPRKNLSPYAPRIYTLTIPIDKIRELIGPGGKMIRSIVERTGVKIDVEDDGPVNVASADESSAKAIAIIQEITAIAELNKTYLGKVRRLSISERSSKSSPGPTVCCTFPRSRTIASSRSATS